MYVAQPSPQLADTDKLLPTVITQLKMDRGLALQDLITGTYEVLETVELPKQARVYLLDQLGLCE